MAFIPVRAILSFPTARGSASMLMKWFWRDTASADCNGWNGNVDHTDSSACLRERKDAEAFHNVTAALSASHFRGAEGYPSWNMDEIDASDPNLFDSDGDGSGAHRQIGRAVLAVAHNYRHFRLRRRQRGRCIGSRHRKSHVERTTPASHRRRPPGRQW